MANYALHIMLVRDYGMFWYNVSHYGYHGTPRPSNFVSKSTLQYEISIQFEWRSVTFDVLISKIRSNTELMLILDSWFLALLHQWTVFICSFSTLFSFHYSHALSCSWPYCRVTYRCCLHFSLCPLLDTEYILTSYMLPNQRSTASSTKPFPLQSQNIA